MADKEVVTERVVERPEREVIVDREPRRTSGWVIAAVVLAILLLILLFGGLFRGAGGGATGGSGGGPQVQGQ
jgi:hypothetical protein